ncbi:response regulator [Paracnuella aquatica]|uniref:response regulator n=1 Tax=Paracnuella aquatica TaxID=2268757 RepID=UPI000DEEAF53|nr:response regulator [Paracnuella aquatica]RPD49090.1 response regulator [Paracnuella aquatica]
MYSQPILIVEDDEDDQNLLSSAFEKIGKRELVRFFKNGHDLLRHLDAMPPGQHPALVVLDYNMPLLNGGQTLRRIRAHATQHSVPAVVFSTGFTSAITKELSELQVLACVQKGAAFDKLVQQARYFTELIADEFETLIGNY